MNVPVDFAVFFLDIWNTFSPLLINNHHASIENKAGFIPLPL